MALFVSAGSAIDEGSRGVSIGSFGSNESTDGLAGSMMGGLVKPGASFSRPFSIHGLCRLVL